MIGKRGVEWEVPMWLVWMLIALVVLLLIIAGASGQMGKMLEKIGLVLKVT
ncbi:hypothetical protein HYU18_03830 [Candidatus Woesearchaeota archaeon]|nr:hypothetical protein [Candidatus Woesearchaeota archaeon]